MVNKFVFTTNLHLETDDCYCICHFVRIVILERIAVPVLGEERQSVKTFNLKRYLGEMYEAQRTVF